MQIFIDTSAFYAVLVADDANHAGAASTIDRLQAEDDELVTSSYVLQETIALLQARIGLSAVRQFAEHVVPGLRIEWVDESDFRFALTALLAANSRSISLTDWTSFEIMRRLGIQQAFAYDTDFQTQGFESVS